LLSILSESIRNAVRENKAGPEGIANCTYDEGT
jgi:hypothetical protein